MMSFLKGSPYLENACFESQLSLSFAIGKYEVANGYSVLMKVVFCILCSNSFS